jgi:TRAP-type C4-dicarboxylate transport system permease small subunit
MDSTNEPQDTIVLSTERHLKWDALDAVERVLMWLSGLLLFTFTTAVLVDVVTRTIGIPVVWLQEVTLGTFVWGVFIGGAAAVRRNEHFLLARIVQSMSGRKRSLFETINHLVLLGVALFLACFGFVFCLQGFGIYSQPSGTPLAVITVSIPISGLLIALFTIERLVNGWRHGFAADEDELLRTYAKEGGVGE